MTFCIDKNIDDITLNDVEFLIKSGIKENIFLDYKLELYGYTNSAKRELLKDVSAFANSSGGDLIIGVEEEKHLQKFNLVGVKTSNIAKEIDRIEQIIYAGLEPRLDCFKIKSIEITKNTYILIIRIEKSPLFPHMISFQRNSRFYVRKSDKNILLDVYELRDMFLKSENIEENIRNENKKRILNVLSNDTIIPIIGGPKLMINFIPYNFSKNINKINFSDNEIKLPLPHKRINFDGLLSYQTNNSGIDAYCQIYRSGIIEFVTTSNKVFGNVYNPFNKNEKINVIYGYENGFENYIINKSLALFKLAKSLNIKLPIYVFVSIIDANGYRIIYKNHDFRNKLTNTIDREILELPEVELKPSKINFKKSFLDIINMIWNACGENKSINI